MQKIGASMSSSLLVVHNSTFRIGRMHGRWTDERMHANTACQHNNVQLHNYEGIAFEKSCYQKLGHENIAKVLPLNLMNKHSITTEKKSISQNSPWTQGCENQTNQSLITTRKPQKFGDKPFLRSRWPSEYAKVKSKYANQMPMCDLITFLKCLHLKWNCTSEIYATHSGFMLKLIIDFYGSNHRIYDGIYVKKYVITEVLKSLLHHSYRVYIHT